MSSTNSTAVGESRDDSALRRMAQALAGTSIPLAWSMGIAVVLGLVVGALVGASVNKPTALVTAILAALLAAIGSQGPLLMGLRTVTIVGLATVVVVVVAVLTTDTWWAVALATVVVVYLSTVVQIIPAVGQALSMVGLMFFIIAGDSIGAGQALDDVVIASILGLVIALLVTVLVHALDPRKISRQTVAKTFDPATTLAEIGNARVLLAFDGHPDTLESILRCAGLARVGRDLTANQADEPATMSAIAAANAEVVALQTAMRPRGQIAGRSAEVTDLIALNDACLATQLSPKTRLGLDQLRSSLARARGLIEGAQQPDAPRRMPGSLGEAVLRSVARPEPNWVRYGLQRAIALGVAMAIYKYFDDGDRIGFWALLAMFLVLQPRGIATVTSAVQRSVGTVAGFVFVSLITLVLPASVLPYLMVLCLFVGIAIMPRNPVLSTLFICGFIVLLIGSANHDVVAVGGKRLLATVIGCALALLVTRFFLPAHAYPRLRLAKARTAVAALIDGIARDLPGFAGGANPKISSELAALDVNAIRSREAAAGDSTLIGDAALRDQFEQGVIAISDIQSDARAFVLLAARDVNNEVIEDAIAATRQRLINVDAIIAVMPERNN